MKSADYYRAVLLGVVIGMGFLSLLYVFLGPEENVKPVSSQKFEVVDRYDNRCEVVRYTPDNSAHYTYFLDCSNKQN